MNSIRSEIYVHERGASKRVYQVTTDGDLANYAVSAHQLEGTELPVFVVEEQVSMGGSGQRSPWPQRNHRPLYRPNDQDPLQGMEEICGGDAGVEAFLQRAEPGALGYVIDTEIILSP